MSNLYHKFAFASVCTALSFTLVASKEAKAATLGYQATTTFFIENFPDPSYIPDSNRPTSSGKRLYTNLEGGNYFIITKDRINGGEKRSFHEFSISNLFLIEKAIFSFGLESEPGGYYPQWGLGLSGYVGDGVADLSDYGSGEYLGNQSPKYPGRIEFNVTQFVKNLVSNQNDFAGFGINIAGKAGEVKINNTYYSQPLLIIETPEDVPEPPEDVPEPPEDVPEPTEAVPEPTEAVPEPTTIFGSALALSLGGWLKRKKSSQQNKTPPQH